MAPDLDPDDHTLLYRFPHLPPLHHHPHQHPHQLPLFRHQQTQVHQPLPPNLPHPIRHSPPNSATSLPPLSSLNDSSPSQLPLPRQPNRRDVTHFSLHDWPTSLKQDGSSVSQAVSAGKDSDPDAAELSQARGGTDMVRQKHLGQLSIELDRKINKRKSMSSSNPIRVCRFCNRQFPSGRALGGHMRVHGALFPGTIAKSLVKEADVKKDQQQERTTFLAKSSSSHPDDYINGNFDFPKNDHNSRLKARHLSGSDIQSDKGLLFGESTVGEPGTEDDARSERVPGSSQTNSDGDQYTDDGMLPYSQRKEHSRGSSEFTSHHQPQLNDEVLDDGVISSEGKSNPLHRLRRNPKRSRRFTDQEFALEVLATNPAIAFSAKRSGSTSPERARRCSECGKVFWSWKALFGHMRCHPEREWRGIQRPESSSMELQRAGLRKSYPTEYSFADNSELELQSDVENKEGEERERLLKIPTEEVASTIRGDLDTTNARVKRNESEDPPPGRDGGRRSADSMLKEFMDDWTPCWPTGKRSRRSRPCLPGLQMQSSSSERALISETVTSNQLESQEDLDMANCLVMLATCGARLDEVERDREESTEESAFSDSGRNETPQLDAQGYSEEDVEGVDEADLRECGNIVNDALFAGKYECSTCKRCFNSHQALGGHRASHRKTKGCFARTNLPDERADGGEDDLIEDEFFSSEVNKWPMHFSGPLEEERAGSLHSFTALTKVRGPDKQQFKGAHECSICHRVFTSGQALGGHKRCHWTGDKPADTASVASSNNRQSSLPSGGQTKKMNEEAIDLNLPAPLDEEDEAGNGSTEEVTPAYGTVLEASKDEQKVLELADHRHRSNSHGVIRDWTVKNVDKGNGDGLRIDAGRELEGRREFDGRSGIWTQQWSAGATQLPQMCSMQPL